MTRDEKILYNNVARALGGTTKSSRVKDVIKAFSEELAQMLYMYGEVNIEGFGKFKVSDAPKTGGVFEVYNFQTGQKESKYIEKSIRITFKSSDKIRTLASGKPVGEYKKGRLKSSTPKTARKKTKEEIEYERKKFLEEKRG